MKTIKSTGLEINKRQEPVSIIVITSKRGVNVEVFASFIEANEYTNEKYNIELVSNGTSENEEVSVDHYYRYL